MILYESEIKNELDFAEEHLDEIFERIMSEIRKERSATSLYKAKLLRGLLKKLLDDWYENE